MAQRFGVSADAMYMGMCGGSKATHTVPTATKCRYARTTDPPFAPTARKEVFPLMSDEVVLLAGKKLEYPRACKDAWDVQGEGTFKRVKRKSKTSQEQPKLL